MTCPHCHKELPSAGAELAGLRKVKAGWPKGKTRRRIPTYIEVEMAQDHADKASIDGVEWVCICAACDISRKYGWTPQPRRLSVPIQR